jgi:hypothetical protein
MPRQSADGTSQSSIAIRTATELKDRLEKAAKDNGRSISREAEARLIQSFSSNGLLNEAGWSDATRNIARIVGLVLNNIDAIDGRPWNHTIEGLEAAQAGVAAALDLKVVGGGHRQSSPDDIRRAQALKDLAVALGRHLNLTAQASELSDEVERVGEVLEGVGKRKSK